MLTMGIPMQECAASFLSGFCERKSPWLRYSVKSDDWDVGDDDAILGRRRRSVVATHQSGREIRRGRRRWKDATGCVRNDRASISATDGTSQLSNWFVKSTTRVLKSDLVTNTSKRVLEQVNGQRGAIGRQEFAQAHLVLGYLPSPCVLRVSDLPGLLLAFAASLRRRTSAGVLLHHAYTAATWQASRH